MGPTWVLSAPDWPHVGPGTLLSGMVVRSEYYHCHWILLSALLNLWFSWSVLDSTWKKNFCPIGNLTIESMLPSFSRVVLGSHVKAKSDKISISLLICVFPSGSLALQILLPLVNFLVPWAIGRQACRVGKHWQWIIVNLSIHVCPCSACSPEGNFIGNTQDVNQ